MKMDKEENAPKKRYTTIFFFIYLTKKYDLNEVTFMTE